MNAIRSATVIRSTRRRGLFAISEMLVLVAALVGLFWLGSQVVAVVANVPGSAAKANSCSDRRVYRIMVENNGHRLWVYRPNDGIVRLELASKEVDLSMPLSGIEVTAVAHSSDGSTTLMCGLNGSVMLFHGDQEAMTSRIEKKDDFAIEATVSGDGSTALAVTASGQVMGWRRTESESQPFSYSIGSRSAMVRTMLNAAGTELCIARSDGLVTFHEPVTGVECAEPLQVDEAWRQGEECIAYTISNDERYLGIVTSSGKIRVYDQGSRNVVFDVASKENSSAARVTAFAISTDLNQIALATNTATEIQIWNLETGAFRKQLTGHAGIVRSIQFSPTMNRLYSGSYDGTVREWSLETCTELRVID